MTGQNSQEQGRLPIDLIEKAWNRMRIVRAGGGRRDFQTYETVLYELVKAMRDTLKDHETRLQTLE